MSNIPLLERYLGVPLVRLHDAIHKGTRGRIGQRLPWMSVGPPFLLLHTMRSVTGPMNTDSLVYAIDASKYVVVASNHGEPWSPRWYHRIRADHRVEITVAGHRMPATAKVVHFDDLDYERLWDLVNDNAFNRYRICQARKRRRIPIVTLTPCHDLGRCHR
ncbi:F420H(2)-dependent quinone reductase (plasmid) [Mycolicibacterium arabiense]|uniref:F420H(2)-dependent quinone reductase n=1 Tax=Mycolicibacterium arabiense TaxID=1286181 RepID=A0A7I7RQB1_9MYCO|nr:nitroreductase/quinone reductase family protein [Mycolicibacterium arabiense]MCV7376943.1 nitroreductase family deazaflavin-dependent oxidoreductase [Mycolicibacterium arabiense]BBY46754.1 F420H(2)-dependent quinone reductase [Mycolicibacterium arabiense]